MSHKMLTIKDKLLFIEFNVNYKFIILNTFTINFAQL